MVTSEVFQIDKFHKNEKLITWSCLDIAILQHLF